MLNTDEDMVLCDFAETYRIYDLYELSPRKVAALACGLRENSRIKMKLTGVERDINTLLMAVCADNLQWLAWSKTDQARHGTNKPQSLVAALTGSSKKSDVVAFENAEAFEKYRRDTIERINKCQQ